jgi:hypothetical protein
MAIDGVRPSHVAFDVIRKVDHFGRKSSQPDGDAPPAPPSSQTPVLAVDFNLFIPQESVHTGEVIAENTPWPDALPIPVAPEWVPIPGAEIHAGDGREIGEPGTSRIAHTINLYPNPSGDPPYIATIDVEVGESHQLDTDGNIIEAQTQSADGLQAEVVEIRDDGTVVVAVSGEASNPVQFGAPGITYHTTVEMHPNDDLSWTVSIQGDHDGFPAYEVLASVEGGPQELVYGYDPREAGASPLDLFGSAEVEFSSEQRIFAPAYTAQSIVQANTADNGQVDARNLGAALAEVSSNQPRVDQAFINEAMSLVPPEQRDEVAAVFFEGLSLGTGGTYADADGWTYIDLASTPGGVDVMLEMGRYAPEALASPDMIRVFAAISRSPIHAGNEAWSAIASRYLTALAYAPEAQRELAATLNIALNGDGFTTPASRNLEAQVDRILQTA